MALCFKSNALQMRSTGKDIFQLQKDGMSYSIYKPHFPLSAFIDHFLVAKGMPTFSEERLFPGNKIELFINLGSRNECQLATSNRKFVFSETILSGLRSSYLNIFPGELFFIAGMRFTLFGFSQLFNIPASEIADENFCASDVLGNDLMNVKERLMEVETEADIIDVLEQWILKVLVKGKLPGRAWDNVAHDLQFNHTLNQNSLAESMGYSHKHTIQLIRAKAGLTPKLIQRIYRLNSILHQLHQLPNPDWQSVIFNHGYFDQSHFIRDFKGFTGLTPSEIVVQRPKDFELRQLR